jgi:hypothetical protein
VTPEEGWVVLVSYDASSGVVQRSALGNPVRAEAPLHVLYACAGSGTISLRVFVAAPPAVGGPNIRSRSDDCAPDVRLFTTVAPSVQRWIDVDVSVSSSATRYWAVLTVPAEAIVPID